PGDILVIEADPEALASALSTLGLKLEEDVRGDDEAGNGDRNARGDAAARLDRGGESPDRTARKAPKATKRDDKKRAIQSDEVVLTELAVLPSSKLTGRSATDIGLRTRFGLNLLAVSRQGHRSLARLRTMPLKPGDVLLMQGNPDTMNEFAGEFGCVPFAERPLRLPDARKATIAIVTMLAAVGGAAMGLLPAAVSFAAGALVMVTTRIVSPGKVY